METGQQVRKQVRNLLKTAEDWREFIELSVSMNIQQLNWKMQHLALSAVLEDSWRRRKQFVMKAGELQIWVKRWGVYCRIAKGGPVLGDYGGLWHRYGKFVKFYVLICAFLHASGLQFTALVTHRVVATCNYITIHIYRKWLCPQWEKWGTISRSPQLRCL